MKLLRGIAISSTLAAGVYAADATVTFNKDVLPILQANCQGCHRPGEVAPMSLLTYAEARPYARACGGVTASPRQGGAL